MEFKGGKELFNRLRKLDEKLERNIGKKAIRAGANHYARTVRKGIPLDSTDDINLRRSVAVATPKRSANKLRILVGIKGAARRYAHIFEWGSKYVTGTRHFSRTFRQEAPEILNKMAEKIKAELAKV